MASNSRDSFRPPRRFSSITLRRRPGRPEVIDITESQIYNIPSPNGQSAESEDSDLAMAVKQSIDENRPSTRQDSLISVIAETTYEGMDIKFLKLEFMNSKRDGFDAENVIFEGKEPEKDLTFDDKLKDYCCVVCLSLPFRPQYCQICKLFYCKNCLDKDNSGCTAQPRLDYRGIQRDRAPHDISGMEISARRFLDNYVQIRCEYGEMDNSGNFKYMDYTTAQDHFSLGQCPKGFCNKCGLFRHNQSIIHKTSEDCMTEMKEFTCFITAKRSHENSIHEKEFREKVHAVHHITEKFTQMERKYEDLKKEHAELNKAFNSRERVFGINDITKKVSELEKIVLAKEKQIVSDNRDHPTDINLFANSTAPHDQGLRDPILFINNYNLGRREMSNFSRNNTFQELLSKSLDLWAIPRTELNNYTFLDVRLQFRHDDTVVGSALRNVHTFNLVKKTDFDLNSTYEFHVDNCAPRYVPNQLSRERNAPQDTTTVTHIGRQRRRERKRVQRSDRDSGQSHDRQTARNLSDERASQFRVQRFERLVNENPRHNISGHFSNQRGPRRDRNQSSY